MKVKFKQAISGGYTAYPGQILEVKDKEANRLIAAEICTAVTDADLKEHPIKEVIKAKRPRVNTR